MKTLINAIKNNKVKTVFIALAASIGMMEVAHAAVCSGPFDVLIDVRGYAYHQHFAINYYGVKVATFWHY